MTHYQALFIKVLRVRWGYSWRQVHKMWQLRYVPKEDWWFNNAIVKSHEDFSHIIGEMNWNIPHGHQIRGMELCNEAMDLLGETVEEWGGFSL